MSILIQNYVIQCDDSGFMPVWWLFVLQIHWLILEVRQHANVLNPNTLSAISIVYHSISLKLHKNCKNIDQFFMKNIFQRISLANRCEERTAYLKRWLSHSTGLVQCTKKYFGTCHPSWMHMCACAVSCDFRLLRMTAHVHSYLCCIANILAKPRSKCVISLSALDRIKPTFSGIHKVK